MKTLLSLTLQITMVLFVVLSCTKKKEDETAGTGAGSGNQGAASTRYYLADSTDTVIAEQITSIFDGRLFKFTNGPFFILSGRNDYANAFSSQMPMKFENDYFGMNCKFENEDCSGPCLIDANHSQPIPNSLLIANEQEHLVGKADRVYQYTDQPMIAKAVQTRARLELYGFGPYCQKIDSILDHYYSLDNVSWKMPDLHNRGFHVVTFPGN
ncbi:hypothetical protein CIK05_11455 [Bdellovibrio sp. qaytius]|nr:hypothetical protein CIK05_11455 [Bdellovibrio sp. qaytius]